MEDNNKFAGIELATITFKQIDDTKYGELNMLIEHLGVSIKTTFGKKKDVICKEIWRAVKIKREQLEAGLSDEEIAKDNEEREKLRNEGKEAQKIEALKKEQKEVEKIVQTNKESKQPITKEYAIMAIATIQKSLRIKKKTPGQRKNSLAKLRKYELILADYEKQEQENQ